MTKTTPEKGVDLTTYDSLQEAVGLVSRTRRSNNRENDVHIDDAIYSRERAGESWFGIDGDAVEVLKTVRTGWNKGADRIAKVLDSIDAPPCVSVRRVRRRSDQGDEIDMQQVWAGHLDIAWESRVRQFVPGPRRVRIIVDIGGNAGVTAEQMFWRGAVCVRLAGVLQDAGYAIEIGAGFASHHGRGTDAVYIPVVTYGESMSTAHLAAVVALSGFFRTVGFSHVIASPSYKVDMGLGSSAGATFERVMTQQTDPNELTVMLTQRIQNLEHANAEMTRVIDLL